jgi:hypothetical protein
VVVVVCEPDATVASYTDLADTGEQGGETEAVQARCPERAMAFKRFPRCVPVSPLPLLYPAVLRCESFSE